MARRQLPAGSRRPVPARKTPGGKVSPQFQVVALLMAEGELTRAELANKIDVKDAQQLSNALFNARSVKRIKLDKATDKYSVTQAGRDWANADANLDNQRASGKTSPAAVKRARREPAQRGKDLDKGEQKRLGVVPVTSTGRLRGGLHLATTADVQQLQVMPAASFRCAIASDRCFALRKGDTEIELTPSETLELLLYVDRIRGMEVPAPVAAAA